MGLSADRRYLRHPPARCADYCRPEKGLKEMGELRTYLVYVLRPSRRMAAPPRGEYNS